jgi:hypothetical protein
VQQRGHLAEHSPASITEVKNEWSYTSVSPNTFIASAVTAMSLGSFKDAGHSPGYAAPGMRKISEKHWTGGEE